MSAPPWFLLASITAVLYAVEGAAAKALTRRGVRPEFLAWASTVLALPWLAAWLARTGLPEVRPAFWGALAASVAGNTVALQLYFSAFARGDLSLVFPLLALTPLWMLASSKAITGEFPGPGGLAGIGLIVAGGYVLGLSEPEAARVGKGPLAVFLGPFRSLARDPGARLALGVSVLWSLTSNFDKVAVEASSPSFYPTLHAVALTATLAPWVLLRCPAEFRRLSAPRDAAAMAGLGALVAGLVVTQFLAIDLAQATLVVAVKRAGLVPAVLIGWLVFGEAYGLRRALASALVLAGLILVVRN